MEKVFAGKRFAAGVCIAVLLVMLQGCFKSDEQKAYEEAVSTVSLQKIASFFEKYPNSKYGELIIAEFSATCDVDPDSKGCYRMILKASPKDNVQYGEILNKIENVK